MLAQNLKISFRRFFLPLLSAIVLAACGASSNSDNASRGPGVSGTVYVQQGPVAGATVVLKTNEGQLLGQATTNDNGEYFIATTVSGPYMAQATTPSGAVWYSISQNERMNISHISDFMLKRWYAVQSPPSVSSAFLGLTASTPMPDEEALDEATNTILGATLAALNVDSLDVFADDIAGPLEKVLRGTTVVGSVLEVHLTNPNLDIHVDVSTARDSEGAVQFSGVQTIITASALNQGFWNRVASLAAALSPISSAHAATVSTNLTAVVDDVHNHADHKEHWMDYIWNSIKDRKISNIVLPGTHDSGTYKTVGGIAWNRSVSGGVTSGSNGLPLPAYAARNAAKTQTNSIAAQLKDGIRYFDIRLNEKRHWGCADPSVWVLYHTYQSYPFQDALNEMASFLKTPENSKEVFVLDFQQIDPRYEDDRAVDVLLGMIQTKLGPYLATSDWKTKTLAELVASNQRIVVILQNEHHDRINRAGYQPGCGAASYDKSRFFKRGDDLLSYYDEFATGDLIKNRVLDAQLNKAASDSANEPDPANPGQFIAKASGIQAKDQTQYSKYVAASAAQKLKVLQIVPRVSNAWYVWSVAAAGVSETANSAVFRSGGNGFGFDLLTYVSFMINGPLNYKYQISDMGLPYVNEYSLFLMPPDSRAFQNIQTCKTGWLGKRLRMGLEGNPTNWNAPNVVMVDNYKPESADPRAKFDWILPDHQSGSWQRGSAGGFVDMIIALNQINPTTRRLTSVTDMQDANCLP